MALSRLESVEAGGPWRPGALLKPWRYRGDDIHLNGFVFVGFFPRALYMRISHDTDCAPVDRPVVWKSVLGRWPGWRVAIRAIEGEEIVGEPPAEEDIGREHQYTNSAPRHGSTRCVQFLSHNDHLLVTSCLTLAHTHHLLSTQLPWLSPKKNHHHLAALSFQRFW